MMMMIYVNDRKFVEKMYIEGALMSKPHNIALKRASYVLRWLGQEKK